MATITYTATYTVISCGHDGCGVRFALDEAFRTARQEDHGTFYCPNGHSRWYPPGSSAAEKLRAELDQAQADARWQREAKERAQRTADAERRSAIALKGHLTRMRRRVANGVCPVPGCKRSGFEKVMAHISTQHAGWLAEHPEVAS